MQNAWVEFPEATWTENAFSGCFDLRLSRLPAPARAKAARSGDPVRRDARGAQHDKSEIVFGKNQIIKTVEIQTDPLPGAYYFFPSLRKETCPGRKPGQANHAAG
jgi:hypothetical protein